MEDRHQPLVDRHRLGEAPGPGQAEDGLAFLREHVGHSRDPALGAHRHAFQDHVVEAGEEDEALAHLVAYVDEAAGVAGAVLEADDVLAVGQGNQDVRGDVVPVDRRVVVDHHRQVGAAGHAAEMLGGLVRLGGIDQRRHHHDAVDADPLHRLGHLRRAGAGELGDPADHRHAAAGGILGDLGDGHLLLDGQRGVLADAAAYHQPGHAVAHQVGNDRVGFLQVHREIGVELGGDRGEYAAPVDVLAHGFSFFVFRIRIQSDRCGPSHRATAAFAVVGDPVRAGSVSARPLPAVDRGGQQWPPGQVSDSR